MHASEVIIYILVGCAVGAGLVYLLFLLVRQQIIKEAREEANELLKETQEQYNAEELERTERIAEIQLEAWSEVEEAHLVLEQKCEDLELKVNHKKTLNEEKYKTLRASLMLRETELRDTSIKHSSKQAEIKKISVQLKEVEENLKNSLTEKTQLQASAVIDDLKNKLIDQAQIDYSKSSEAFLEETKEFSEQKAKRIIGLCIERFQKEMSTERGISASHFPTEEIRKAFCENLKENIAIIQAASGCDVHIEENPETPDRWHYIQIVGYDPVRRELTRRIFDRIFRDMEKHRRKVTPQDLKRISENLKTELLNQIKRDGDVICKELGLQNVHSEIR
jgi:ribonucrease Y